MFQIATIHIDGCIDQQKRKVSSDGDQDITLIADYKTNHFSFSFRVGMMNHSTAFSC